MSASRWSWILSGGASPRVCCRLAFEGANDSAVPPSRCSDRVSGTFSGHGEHATHDTHPGDGVLVARARAMRPAAGPRPRVVRSGLHCLGRARVEQERVSAARRRDAAARRMVAAPGYPGTPRRLRTACAVSWRTRCGACREGLEGVLVSTVDWAEAVQKTVARAVAIDGMREEPLATGVRIECSPGDKRKPRGDSGWQHDVWASHSVIAPACRSRWKARCLY